MGEMGRAFDGSYAEYALLPNDQIYTVETDLPIETLAAFPETYYTAYGSMLNLKIREGDSVLVRGATSGVGIAFMKLVKAKYPDIKVTGTSRKEAKIQRLLDEGFDAVVLDIHNELQTEEKYDKVLDLIGPAALRDTFLHMNEGSIVCVTGLLGGIWALDSFDPLEDLPENAYITSFHSGNVTSEKMQKIIDFIKEHKVEIKAEKVFRLEDVPKAHEYLESADSFGKVVVIND
ncbi:MAG: zinc-binding dehydrogenase, partial [Eubacterium sp.]|nr:zinc-binding dehydrogenase [Eubacterium sp.]